MARFWGKPCKSNTGGPLPAIMQLMMIHLPISICRRSNSSNIAHPFALHALQEFITVNVGAFVEPTSDHLERVTAFDLKPSAPALDGE